MEPSGISKKEYLKKYLSKDDKKKKKKKKSTQSLIIKSKIVDDDIDLKNMKPLNEDDLEIFDFAEDAPQIAGIIDERPEEIRIMSEFRSTKKWKIVTDEYGIEDVKITAIDRRKTDDGTPKMEKEISIEIRKNSEWQEVPEAKKQEPQTVVIKKEKDASPPRGVREKDDSDASPPRKKKNRSDSDESPPRKTRRKRLDSDSSPPRRPIKKERDSDSSPPRRRPEKDDSDASPPRRRLRRSQDRSPRRNSASTKSRTRDLDRSKNGRSESKRCSRAPSAEDSAKKSARDALGFGLQLSKSRSGETDGKERKASSQLEKTLSGKRAGLQSAEDTRKEGERLRQRDKEILEKMPDEISGRNAEAIVRNRKTGRRRDAKEEARLRREKEEKEAEKIAQYAVWGKGVKQIHDRQEKLNDEQYEMSKPLARYKDDKDLDEMLKNQEWEGDPMLEYIRKKKRKESSGAQVRQQYEGLYPPNRYDIKPGHKWDGVDRSNGYEKRWFDEQNAKKAREEEAFKWSTADM